MAHPLLFEINARHWVSELSRAHGKPVDLASIPDRELDALAEVGITHLWLMGVWPTGPRSKAEALRHPDLRNAYSEAVPDWKESDVLGSPYAIAQLHVSPLLGGDPALASLRSRLAHRGIRLLLDFIPNHLGLDHPWVQSDPLLFVGSHAPFPDSFPVSLPNRTRFLAHGKDPYFPGWTDTVQLDYRRAQTRRAMTELLRAISKKCDGVRCDMAMLVLSEVFEKTWAHVPCEDPCGEAGEFWREAIASIKKEEPHFLFLAEAYWGLEGRLCELGFDYAYDKHLYDLLLHDRPWEVQPHLLGMGPENQRRAHFLENHDEPRVANALGIAKHRAAAALILGLPGMRFLHDGQLQGLHRFARVQLARRATEPANSAVEELYGKLLPAFAKSGVGKGEALLLTPVRAWDYNPTAQCICTVLWQDPQNEDHFELLVVNLAPHRAQCRVVLPLPPAETSPNSSTWLLSDRLGHERWQRDSHELTTAGLFLDVEPHAAQLFSCTRL
ncbi:MAG: hypothetical protein RLZZ142_1556 [Verrucomicrobiota bacterium]